MTYSLPSDPTVPHRPQHDPWMTDPRDPDCLAAEDRRCVLCGRPDGEPIHDQGGVADGVASTRPAAGWTPRVDQETYEPAHRHGLADDRTYVVVLTRWSEPDETGSSRPEGLDVYETPDYRLALERVRQERAALATFGPPRAFAVIDTRCADGCRCLA